jgi:hypothetical protein
MSSNGAGSPDALLAAARVLLADAARTAEPGERFRLAHLAALRVAAAAVAGRDRPARARRRLVNLWTLLPRIAPEYSGWAAYFAAGAATRAAVEAGAAQSVSPSGADEQLRSAGQFLAAVESSFGRLAA